jgi:hypothetical protein
MTFHLPPEQGLIAYSWHFTRRHSNNAVLITRIVSQDRVFTCPLRLPSEVKPVERLWIFEALAELLVMFSYCVFRGPAMEDCYDCPENGGAIIGTSLCISR